MNTESQTISMTNTESSSRLLNANEYGTCAVKYRKAWWKKTVPVAELKLAATIRWLASHTQNTV